MISAEIGGANSFEPLVTGARVGLPVLDADGMGRAFPELQVCDLCSYYALSLPWGRSNYAESNYMRNYFLKK